LQALAKVSGGEQSGGSSITDGEEEEDKTIVTTGIYCKEVPPRESIELRVVLLF